jgi:hypothetical protein
MFHLGNDGFIEVTSVFFGGVWGAEDTNGYNHHTNRIDTTKAASHKRRFIGTPCTKLPHDSGVTARDTQSCKQSAPLKI